MANISRLIALNPFQSPDVVGDAVWATQQGRARQKDLAAQDQAMRLAQHQAAEQRRANRMLSMGSGSMDLARAGLMPQAKEIGALEEIQSESQRRKSQTDIEREKLGLEWAKVRQNQQQRSAQPQNERTVQQAQMLPGGGARILYKDGSIEVRRPEEVDAKFIQDAELRGAEIQGLRAGERKAAGIAQNTAKESFEKAFKVRENIGTLYNVIDEVKAGAGTGPLKARLPSLKAASVRLDNLQKKLGLDLIQATTFGALSESELQFALDTVLPKQLDGPELIQWTENKIAAQTKLAEELEDLAIYLGTPGNNLSTFLLNQRQEQKKAKSQPKNNEQSEQGMQTIGRFQVKVK